jgi:hypothetical protein
MSYFSKLNPAGGLADFWHEFRRPNPYRWPILILSFLITFGILSTIIWQETRIPPPRPQVTYITTFEPGRTEAEIVASNLENQQAQDERRAAQEARDERRREIYRDLGRATGMDVDAIDARIARERAAEEAAQEARRRELAGETSATEAE